MSLKGPDFHTYGRKSDWAADEKGSTLGSFMDENLTSDTWIESNDGDNFVKGGFIYERGFWGRKVRRLVLTEKSLRILHKRTGIVKNYYSLYSVHNVEAQRCTHIFVVTLYTSKGKMKRLYFEPSSAEERKEWMKAIQLCVTVVKSSKQERESSRYGTVATTKRSSSAASLSAFQSGGSGNWESVSDRPELDGRRPVLSKSRTAAELGGFGTTTRMRSATAPSGGRARLEEACFADEDEHGYNPFPSAEQWDLEEPETMGRMGISSSKSAFSRHQMV